MLLPATWQHRIRTIYKAFKRNGCFKGCLGRKSTKAGKALNSFPRIDGNFYATSFLLGGST